MKKAIIGIVVLVVLVGGGYLIFHKSNKTSNNTSTTSYSSNGSTATNPSSSSSTVVIKTATSSSVGKYLTDGSNNALYTYGGDTTGKSNCTGSCLYSWPVYAPGSTTNLPANVTIIKRDDGSSQYAYKGMPLYTFSSDSAGQVTGDGVSNFHVAKP